MARLAGLAEYEWLAGMDPENVKEFRWALTGEAILTRELERDRKETEERVATDPSSVFGDFDVSESDRAELARSERMQVIREATLEEAANGVGGWVDDDLAFLRPWGFDVATLAVPVLIRYGRTDVFTLPAHGEWLAANVPDCIVQVSDSAGHLGSSPEEQLAADARWLSAGIPPEGSYSTAAAGR